MFHDYLILEDGPDDPEGPKARDRAFPSIAKIHESYYGQL
jgi:hypothetical protein